MRDLGVLFDSKLTFTPQFDTLIAKANCLYGVGYRFARDILYPAIILKIISVYITPIIEYCSIVWSQKRLLSKRRLERVRASLRNKAGTGNSISSRPRKLHRLSPAIKNVGYTYIRRRKRSAIIYIIKILQGYLDTELSVIVNHCRHISQHRTRTTNIFDHSRRLMSAYSPLFIALTYTNEFRHYFHIDESAQSWGH